jgi:hypothetical protein
MKKLALLVLVSCAAGRPAARPFVESVYRAYDPARPDDAPWGEHKCRATFSARLCALIEKDRRDAGAEVPRLDGDPLYDAQDISASDLAFAAEPDADGHARVRVTFKNLGQARAVLVALVPEGQSWRIDDITYLDQQPPLTLTQILTSP